MKKILLKAIKISQTEIIQLPPPPLFFSNLNSNGAFVSFLQGFFNETVYS